MNLLVLTLGLLAVLTFSLAGSYLQHRYYLRVVDKLAKQYGGSGYVLVSGIRKGRLRGAVAVLVLSRGSTDRIERTTVMQGTTLFARFRDREDLTGHLTEERLATCSPAVRGAVQDALGRGRKVLLSAQVGPVSDRSGSQRAVEPGTGVSRV